LHVNHAGIEQNAKAIHDLLAKLARSRVILDANWGVRIGLSARRTHPHSDQKLTLHELMLTGE
jgi:hypothetical protein